MKIRTQFTITVAVFGAIFVAGGAALILTNRQVERLHKQETIAHEIELGARELSYLSNDYLLHGESPQRARWEAKYSSFSDLLVRFCSREGPEPAALVNDIKANQERLKTIFNDVASILENSKPAVGGAADIAMVRVSWSRMEVQTQGMAFNASRLARMLEEQADRLGHRRVILLFVLIGVFGAFLVINYGTVNRRILRAISNLQAGTRIIGSGNLEFAIAEKKDDEIGDLSRAFNRMTANLKAVTASKADLEQEMSERKKIEEALKESEAKYRNLFKNMTEGFALHEIITDAKGKPCDYRFLEINPAFERLTGLSREAVIEKTVREVIPNIEAYWIETYGRVALDGSPVRVENYSVPLNRWYLVFAYRTAPGQFAAIFTDITERKRAEEEMRRLSHFPGKTPTPYCGVALTG